MVEDIIKQNLVLLLLESPIIVFLFSARLIIASLEARLGHVAAVFFFWLLFVVVCLCTAFLFFLVRQSALNYVAGQRFLVGHIYHMDGKGELVELALGEYSLIGSLDNGALVYVVWKYEGDERVADYILVTERTLEKELAAASTVTVSAGWWFADAQAYLVTLLKPEAEAVDAIKAVFAEEQEKIGNVPVYILRDAPGRVLDKIGMAETNSLEAANGARRQLDALRSLQLAEENRILREALESFKRADKEVTKLALKLANKFIKIRKIGHSVGGRRPDVKYSLALFGVVVIIILVLIMIF